MLKYISLIVLTFYSLYGNAQDCLLQVPNDPLNTGLFQPWYVSTDPNSDIQCSQLNPGTEVFVEATILDELTGNFFVYNPLVIDSGTTPAIQPEIINLPNKSIVAIHFGTNANSITLIPSICDPNLNCASSLEQGLCVNGITGSVFGQFSHCNAVKFFEKVGKLILNGVVNIPPLKNSTLCDLCPTTRSFSIVDQDQSDNVLTRYIITTDLQLAQDTEVNRNILKVLKIISNGSDNRVLSDFVNPAIGCKSFSAPDLANNTIYKYSLALNEIEANLTDPNSPDTALIPSGNPMCLVNDTVNLEKMNAYRMGVAQPIVNQIDPEDNKNYCNSMLRITIPFLILHKIEFINSAAPGNDASNLLNFLIDRFINSWSILNCEVLTGIAVPLIVFSDENGIIINNNLETLINDQNNIQTYCINQPIPNPCCQEITPCCGETTPTPTIPVTNLDPTNNFCGKSYFDLNCFKKCPNGLDSECDIGTTCFNRPDFCNINIQQDPLNNFCGSCFSNLNCFETCPNGLDSECITPGYKCFNNPDVCNRRKLQQNFNFCGGTYFNLLCTEPCPNGLDSECITPGTTCFKTSNECNTNPTDLPTDFPTDLPTDFPTDVPLNDTTTNNTTDQNIQPVVNSSHILIINIVFILSTLVFVIGLF